MSDSPINVAAIINGTRAVLNSLAAEDAQSPSRKKVMLWKLLPERPYEGTAANMECNVNYNGIVTQGVAEGAVAPAATSFEVLRWQVPLREYSCVFQLTGKAEDAAAQLGTTAFRDLMGKTIAEARNSLINYVEATATGDGTGDSNLAPYGTQNWSYTTGSNICGVNFTTYGGRIAPAVRDHGGSEPLSLLHITDDIADLINTDRNADANTTIVIATKGRMSEIRHLIDAKTQLTRSGQEATAGDMAGAFDFVWQGFKFYGIGTVASRIEYLDKRNWFFMFLDNGNPNRPKINPLGRTGNFTGVQLVSYGGINCDNPRSSLFRYNLA